MSVLFRQLLIVISCPLTILVSTLVPTLAFAAGPSIDIVAPDMNPNDHTSLQRGAKYFMNYCSGCHSLEYIRFNRLAKDIGITDVDGNILEDVLKEDLIFGSQKVADTLTVAMEPADAKKWFGVAPPDLTLESRLRGPDWIYGFLRSFYVDPSAQWGVNNLVYPGTAMPNILGALQGEQKPIYKTLDVNVDGGSMQQQIVTGIEPATNGKLAAPEFDRVVYDLVNFLTYTADPGKVERHRIGVYVLLFIIIFALFAFLLKREYWKDIKKH
jgi:ubiquinol-cytochrome c reductase cytochrome c1 subunit